MSVVIVTTAVHHGITHSCTDPDCHVPGFVATLEQEED